MKLRQDHVFYHQWSVQNQGGDFTEVVTCRAAHPSLLEKFIVESDVEVIGALEKDSLGILAIILVVEAEREVPVATESKKILAQAFGGIALPASCQTQNE